MLNDAKAPNHELVNFEPPDTGATNRQPANGESSDGQRADRNGGKRQRSDRSRADRLCPDAGCGPMIEPPVENISIVAGDVCTAPTREFQMALHG